MNSREPERLHRVEGDAEHLAAAFGIRTVRDLGMNKYFTLAHALVALSSQRDPAVRPARRRPPRPQATTDRAIGLRATE